MKINFIVPFISRVGGIKLIFDYSYRLTKLGHDIVIYYPIYPYNNNPGEFDLVYTLKRFYRLLKQLVSLKNNINKFKNVNFKIKAVPVISNKFIRDADVTVASAWTTAFSVKKLSNSKGEKFYFVQDYENWESNVEYVDRSYKLGLQIITTCSYLSNLLASKFKVDSTIIFIAIDNELFQNKNKELIAPKRILFIDSGMERKNSEMAIRVIKRLQQKYPHLLFGSFGHRKSHEMPDYIEFSVNPSDDKIKELYSNADIFLGTSNVEGFALPPAEAMSCKCAVVTTVVGAVKEYSTNMFSAIHVEPKNENAMFDAVVFLIENPEKWREISLNGYSDAQKYLHCWDESVQKMENVFKSSIKL